MADANSEDEMMLLLLRELRRKNDLSERAAERDEKLHGLFARFADTLVLVNQQCVRIAEALETLEARIALIPEPLAPRAEPAR